MPDEELKPNFKSRPPKDLEYIVRKKNSSAFNFHTDSYSFAFIIHEAYPALNDLSFICISWFICAIKIRNMIQMVQFWIYWLPFH